MCRQGSEPHRATELPLGVSASPRVLFCRRSVAWKLRSHCDTPGEPLTELWDLFVVYFEYKNSIQS